MSKEVRVRFAPSPTGQLHVGSARTALYNWAFSKRHGGTFILRIDDTDPVRSTTENTHAILDALRWLGLEWDEGPDVGGDSGPYFQTKRAAFYEDALTSLVDSDGAYPCFCTVEELDARRAERRSAGGFAGYDRVCRALERSEAMGRIDAREPHVWRLAIPEDRGDVVFIDAVRGEVATPAEVLDDLVIVRSDGSPTYNFATVVDDAQMGITHVIRGVDHISNTPRQIVIFEALGHDAPTFAHMSLTFGHDGKRLSKRHGATSVEAFRDMGFLPEALVNYIALLGWSLDDKTTVLDRETLVANFSLERLSGNPGVFDMEKLEWMNGVYIRSMPIETFTEKVVGELTRAGLSTANDVASRLEWYTGLASLLQERLKRFDEIVPWVSFLFEDEIEIEEAALDKVLVSPGAVESLTAAFSSLGGIGRFEVDAIEEGLRTIPGELGLKPRVVFQAIRVAISGTTVSLPLFESLALLGRDRCLGRLEAAIARLEA